MSDLSREVLESWVSCDQRPNDDDKGRIGPTYGFICTQLLRTMDALKAAEGIARDIKQQSLDRGSLLVDAVARAEKAEAALGEVTAAAADLGVRWKDAVAARDLDREAMEGLVEAVGTHFDPPEGRRKTWPMPVYLAHRDASARLRPEPKPAGCDRCYGQGFLTFDTVRGWNNPCPDCTQDGGEPDERD